MKINKNLLYLIRFFLLIVSSVFNSFVLIFWGIAGIIFFQSLVIDYGISSDVSIQLMNIADIIFRNYLVFFFSIFFLDLIKGSLNFDK